MSFLLLYIGRGQRFDASKVERTLRSSPYACSVVVGGDPPLHCEYRVGDDFTTVRLNRDGETVVIDGTGEASLQAAFDIKQGYGDPIHAIDEGYTFDINLAEVESPADLARRIDCD